MARQFLGGDMLNLIEDRRNQHQAIASQTGGKTLFERYHQSARNNQCRADDFDRGYPLAQNKPRQYQRINHFYLRDNGGVGGGGLLDPAQLLVNLGGQYNIDDGHHILFSLGRSIHGDAGTASYIAHQWTFGPAEQAGLSETRASVTFTPASASCRSRPSCGLTIRDGVRLL